MLAPLFPFIWFKENSISDNLFSTLYIYLFIPLKSLWGKFYLVWHTYSLPL